MHASRSALAALTAVAALAGMVTIGARQAGRLPLEPLGTKGESLFPYLEGWYPNADGTATLLLGYYNRNTNQTIDIPIGPNNKVEPGGPDQGQPTHFLPRRHYGVFTITVPKDALTKKLTWTLVANGHTNVVTFWTNPPYFVEPFKNIANGNTPPVLKFGQGPEMTGPPRGLAQTLSATVGQPLPLTVWASDKPPTIAPPAPPPQPPPDSDAGGGARGAARDRNGRVRPTGPPPPVAIIWTMFRGPADVTIEPGRVAMQTGEGAEAKATATFSQPGEYWLRATANDSSGDGGGGDQCCWTTALVKVNVK